MTDTRTLPEALDRLAILRATSAAASLEWRRLLENFQEQHADLIGEAANLAAVVAEAEAEVRRLAVAAFNAGQGKRPAPGVEVKEFQVVGFDPAAALAWATEHKVCLALDEKRFKAAAHQGIVPATVAIVGMEPRATIAQDLQKALGLSVDVGPAQEEGAAG